METGIDTAGIADRIEIADLLTRYARAVDTRDWDLYREVFTPSAHIDYTSAGGVVGDVETVATWLEETLAAFEMTQHLISNLEVDVDGDEARVRAMFFNPMRTADGTRITCGGWYHHDLVRTDAGWRSRRLVETAAWFDGLPAPS